MCENVKMKIRLWDFRVLVWKMIIDPQGFCELQARLLFIYQQRTYVNKLAVDLQMVYELRHIDMDAEFGDLDVSDYFQQFDWFVTFESLEVFVRNQGFRVERHFNAFDDSIQRDVLTSIGMFAVSIVQSPITLICYFNLYLKLLYFILP